MTTEVIGMGEYSLSQPLETAVIICGLCILYGTLDTQRPNYLG